MVVDRRSPGRPFQMSGAATRKIRRPSRVLVRGTNILPHPAERPETSGIGVQTSLKYAGPVPISMQTFTLRVFTSNSPGMLGHVGVGRGDGRSLFCSSACSQCRNRHGLRHA